MAAAQFDAMADALGHIGLQRVIKGTGLPRAVELMRPKFG